MPAGQYTFTVDQGATFKRSIHWENRDGTPVSITGFAAKMQIRESAAATAALLTISTGSEGGIELVEPNVIELTMTPFQTSALRFETAVYDLKLTSPGGEVTRLIEGRVRLTPAVTR